MLPLYRSWGIPLIIYGIVVVLAILPGVALQFFQSSAGDPSPSFSDRIPGIAIEVCMLAVGTLMITSGVKLRSKHGPGISSGAGPGGDLSRARVNLYFGIAIFIVPFFLLHWNGFLDFTYYWYLRRNGGEHEFLPQILGALVSTLVLSALVVLIFEIFARKKYRDESVPGN